VDINSEDNAECVGEDTLEKSTLTCSIGSSGEFDTNNDAWAQTWTLSGYTLSPDQPFYNSRSPRPDTDDATGVYHVYDLILKGSSKDPDELVSITFQNMMIVSENSLILRESDTLEDAEGSCNK